MFGLSELEGGKYFMNAVRDGESVLMGVNDENECHLWVMAMYRATGQSHKPTPPTTSDTHHKIMGGQSFSSAYFFFRFIWFVDPPEESSIATDVSTFYQSNY